MNYDKIRMAVSAFASHAIRAGYLANPEMRRSSRGKSRGDFRRNREDYSQFKCTIAIVYEAQLSFVGTEEWDRLIDSIRRALNRQSYWIKEILVITTDKLSAQKEPPLMTIQIEETQIVMKAKNASKTLPLADAETEESRRFNELADEGAQMEPVEALRLLTRAYVEACGVSLTLRTIVYEAGEMWQKRLESTDHPLAKQSKDLCLFQLMPLICDEYDPAQHDKYDITCIPEETVLHYAMQVINDYDEQTTQALCFGVRELCSKYSE